MKNTTRAVVDVTPCIINLAGTMTGVLVSGCSSVDGDRRKVTWLVAETATLTRTGDLFNDWAQSTRASGTNADQVVWMSSKAAGTMTIGCKSACFDADRMRISNAGSAATEYVRVGPGGPYRLSGLASTGDRTLGSANTHLVLRQLLFDLAALGLITRR